MDLPLEFHPKNIISGEAFKFVQRPSRLGVITRHATKPIEWFEFEPGFIFHTINAWQQIEKGEEIIYMFGCRSKKLVLNFKESSPEESPYPHCFRINLTTKEKSEHQVSDVSCEFPTIHPSFLGRKNSYAYCATFSSRRLYFDGIVKFKVSTEEFENVGVIKYGPGRYGGEAVFVPKKGGKSEDEGYLLGFIFDEDKQRSEFVVYDAHTMSPKPLATVVLPQRVPYGFHGIFVDEDQIQHQKSL